MVRPCRTWSRCDDATIDVYQQQEQVQRTWYVPGTVLQRQRTRPPLFFYRLPSPQNPVCTTGVLDALARLQSVHTGSGAEMGEWRNLHRYPTILGHFLRTLQQDPDSPTAFTWHALTYITSATCGAVRVPVLAAPCPQWRFWCCWYWFCIARRRSWWRCSLRPQCTMCTRWSHRPAGSRHTRTPSPYHST